MRKIIFIFFFFPFIGLGQGWIKTYGVNSIPETGWVVKQTSDGGFVLTGNSVDTINLSSQTALIKFDSNGNLTSVFNINTSSYNRKLERLVDVLGRETKGKKNEPLLYIYDDGTIEKRIVIE